MDYTVELPMQIQGAETPEEAVEAFIDQIVTFGQRAWTYLVTDEDGNTIRVGHRLDAEHEPLQMSDEGDLDLLPEEESDEPRPEQPPAETE